MFPVGIMEFYGTNGRFAGSIKFISNGRTQFAPTEEMMITLLFKKALYYIFLRDKSGMVAHAAFVKT